VAAAKNKEQKIKAFMQENEIVLVENTGPNMSTPYPIVKR
jgi:hypothetical protein